MRIAKYLVPAFLACSLACKLPDNLDPKNPEKVPSSTIFADAQVKFAQHMHKVKRNITWHIVQYWQNTSAFAESRYDNFINGGPINENWNKSYEILINLKEAGRLLQENELKGQMPERSINQIAIISILEVYTWQCLVDTYGDVPYSEALKAAEGITMPKYDDAETIYIDLLHTLGNALDALDENYGSWDEADLLYGGDVRMWKKFGASLELRIGLRLADINAAIADSAVNAALRHGVFNNPEEGAIWHYTGIVPYDNPLHETFERLDNKDFVPANTIIDKLDSLDDPRIDDWFTPLADGTFKGAVVGVDSAQSSQDFSHFATPTLAADFEFIIMDYTEVEFYLAEGAERGYNVPGTAEQHYKNAIRSSILYWNGTEVEVADYLAREDVAYSTAAGNWREKIGTQKWLAYYNRPRESWAEWRRLDYPCMNIPEGHTYLDLPRRLPYPTTESGLNGENYRAAVDALGGVNDHRQPVFWDVQIPACP